MLVKVMSFNFLIVNREYPLELFLWFFFEFEFECRICLMIRILKNISLVGYLVKATLSLVKCRIVNRENPPLMLILLIVGILFDSCNNASSESELSSIEKNILLDEELRLLSYTNNRGF